MRIANYKCTQKFTWLIYDERPEGKGEKLMEYRNASTILLFFIFENNFPFASFSLWRWISKTFVNAKESEISSQTERSSELKIYIKKQARFQCRKRLWNTGTFFSSITGSRKWSGGRARLEWEKKHEIPNRDKENDLNFSYTIVTESISTCNPTAPYWVHFWCFDFDTFCHVHYLTAKFDILCLFLASFFLFIWQRADSMLSGE